MPDAALDWSGDLSFTPAGDLALVDGDDLARQRIVRRLYTALQGYVWQPTYGTGLLQKIGRTARSRTIAALVRASLAFETSVARVPVPRIEVAESTVTLGLFVITIVYTDAITSADVAITLEVPGRA